ncbi:MAG TPA: PQQ-dependent sugar dehydrogenase [Roseiflexaceae bacterium]|nr:PQQ-dependent sugar dehydrogenase [Roseiflexaceae bacterium]
MIDLIALSLFALFLGTALGGITIVWRVRGRRRWSGLLLTVLGGAAAALLALMSSKYWFQDQTFFHAFINVKLVDLFQRVGGTLLPLAVAGALIFVVGAWLTRQMQRRRWWVGVTAVIALLVTLDVAGTAALVALSKPAYVEQVSNMDRTIALPAGFRAELYSASAIRMPTALAFRPDGALFVSDIPGRIWAFPPQSGPGAAPRLFAEGFAEPLGLAWRNDTLYVASLGRISAIRDSDGDGRADERRDIVQGLPARLFPLHQNNAIKFGPDGRLYFGLGSGNNSAAETNPLTATILSVRPDGSDLQVHARGLRNAYGLAFNAAGDLFATDNAPQGLPIVPGDELNHIQAGHEYGYPLVYELPPPGSPVVAPLVIFAPHTSPTGITFYNGDAFPDEYDDNAFVASWMRGEIYRVRLVSGPGGTYTAHTSVFANGFLNPLDVAVGPEGCLYVADYGVSAIYRICHTG